MTCPRCKSEIDWATEIINERVMYYIVCDTCADSIYTEMHDNLDDCLEEFRELCDEVNT